MAIEMHERIRQTKDGIWVIDGDSHITKWCEEQGRLDTDRTIDRICELIPVGGVAIDGGASIGDHTIAYARKVGPTGQVFAFEPNPAPFCCLTMNMAPYPWVHPLRLALGNENNWVGFVLESNNVGKSRVASNLAEVGGSLRLPVIKANVIGELIKRLDFIKLDLEGYEDRAIHGMSSLLRWYMPKLLIEINRDLTGENRIMSMIEHLEMDYGYHVQNFDPTKPDDLSGTQFDLLCTPK